MALGVSLTVLHPLLDNFIFCSKNSGFSLDNGLLLGNNISKASFININDFQIIKAFNVVIKPPKTPSIKQVLCNPLCNTGGAFAQDSSVAGGGGIFPNHFGNLIFTFAEPLRAEFGVAIKTMESTNNREIGRNFDFRPILFWWSKPSPTILWSHGRLERLNDLYPL